MNLDKLFPRLRGFEASRLRGPAKALGSRVLFRVGFSQPPDESKDYEKLCSTGETFVYAAMTRLMVRRLARS